METIKIYCYSDHFQVYEEDNFGQKFEVCNFWSYDGDSFDGFVKFLKYKQLAYEVIDME